MRHLTATIYTLLLFLLPSTGRAELKTIMESAYLVAGETTYITVYISVPHTPKSKPQPPTANKDITLRRGREEHRMVSRNGQRSVVHFYQFSLQSFVIGTHKIGSFTIEVNGQTYRSRPREIHVKPVDSITWQNVKIGNESLRYGSAIFTPDRQPFVGEAFPAEVKLYLPRNIGIAERGLAELDQNGLTAWRFEPSNTNGQASLPLGQYNVLSYRSTASAIREGECSLGPGKTRVSLQSGSRRSVFATWNSVPVSFPLNEHKINARPLPPGAPADFDGAVGNFMIASSAEIENLEEGDPIATNITVAGTGNLDSLRAPKLIGEESDWKTYEASKQEREGERRNMDGSVRFSQIIRPLTAQKVIPPYQLSYFDPKTERYQTVKTAPIKFEVIPSKTAVLTTPAIASTDNAVRDMQGILGLVNPLRPQHQPTLWAKYWQFIPAAIVTILLLLIAKKKLNRPSAGPKQSQLVRQALSNLEQNSSDSREFLRAAGHFIEEWIPLDKRDEELEKILSRRDEECFRPETKPQELPHKERSEVISTLRAKAMAAVSILLLFLTAPFTDAQEIEKIYQQAETAWKEKRYLSAIDYYQQAHPDGNLPADVDYNIANCHYRLGEPGKAALHYHRALAKDPKHREAKLNLEYLIAEQGTIEADLPDSFLQKLVFFPTPVYQQMLYACLWITAIAILILIIFRTLISRVLAWITLPLALLGSIYAGAIYFGLSEKRSLKAPNELSAPEQLSVVTSKKALPARTEPHESAPTIITAPPGVKCVRLAERGAWTYLEFADLSRGWLPTSGLTPLTVTEGADSAFQTGESI